MPADVPVFPPRLARKAVIGGVLLVLAAGYVVSRGEHGAGDSETPHGAASHAGPAPTPIVSSAQALPSATASAVGADTADAPRSLAVYTPQQASDKLRAFFDKILNREKLSSNDIDELQARLLDAIEADPAVAKAVEQFYRNMPAEQGMERDILRSMLVASSAGRDIVLQEANAIWESKAEAKFAEMYETYFNLPGQAPPEVLGRALADLKKGAPADERTAVARLNFLGVLENQSIPDAANLRSEAVQLLNQLAEGQGSELVRALAVQKLYRLNSPGEAANIAVGQLSKGAYADLVRETLNSVDSGDVELTPNLRTALTTAVKRPSASAEERQQFSKVVGARS